MCSQPNNKTLPTLRPVAIAHVQKSSVRTARGTPQGKWEQAGERHEAGCVDTQGQQVAIALGRFGIVPSRLHHVVLSRELLLPCIFYWENLCSAPGTRVGGFRLAFPGLICNSSKRAIVENETRSAFFFQKLLHPTCTIFRRGRRTHFVCTRWWWWQGGKSV